MAQLPPIDVVRRGSATWTGTVADGSGVLVVGDNRCELDYSLQTCLDAAHGASPEDLLGAAHAACYSMALARVLEDAGYPPPTIAVTAAVRLDDRGQGLAITQVALAVESDLDIGDQILQRYAQIAHDACPVSKLFSSAEISISAATRRPS